MTWDELRQKSTDSLLWFAVGCLGYDRLTPEIHGPWAEWCEDYTNLRRIRLAPRSSFKTSLLTIAFALWTLIQEGEVLPGVKGVDARILIASDSGSRASDMLREIRQHTKTEAFRRCFGATAVDLDNSKQLTLSTRKKPRREPSITAAGVGDQLTSSHYDMALISDVVSNDDRDSQAARDQTERWISDVLSLVAIDGLVQVEGTRWSALDWYGKVVSETNVALETAGHAPWDVQVQGAISEANETTFRDIGLTRAALDRLRIDKGTADYQAQYLNMPLSSDELIFQEDDFTTYDELPKLTSVVGFLDPSLGKRQTSDFSAIVILGVDEEGVPYLVEASLERRRPEAIRAAVVELFGTYPFEKFGIENVGFQDVLITDIQADLLKAGHPLQVTRVPARTEKISRIQSAESRIKACRIPSWWRSSAGISELLRQTFSFPGGRYDDGPDSWTGAVGLLTKGWSKAQILALASANQKAVKPSAGSKVLAVDTPKPRRRESPLKIAW